MERVMKKMAKKKPCGRPNTLESLAMMGYVTKEVIVYTILAVVRAECLEKALVA